MNTLYYNDEDYEVDDAVYQEWLEWFYVNADFGPAHGDVLNYYTQQFFNETGYGPKED